VQEGCRFLHLRLNCGQICFIEEPPHPPNSWQRSLLPQSTIHEGRSGVDLLYTQVLEQAVDNVDVDDQEFYTCLKTILGAVLLMVNPLSVKALSELLDISNILLHSPFPPFCPPYPTSTATPIRVFHKSFPDFLTDQNRCKDQRFFVEPATHHTEILFSCLKLMKERLRRNICNLDDYAVLHEVNDLWSKEGSYWRCSGICMPILDKAPSGCPW
jgi:hypothetical protein